MDHIFREEQEEYQREDIAWTNIGFHDNREIVNLLAVKPCNLLALIDEESQFPRVGALPRIPLNQCCLYWERKSGLFVARQGSDLSMLQKMNQHHTGNRNYVASRREGDADFGIRHFAGVVYYESRGKSSLTDDQTSARRFFTHSLI